MLDAYRLALTNVQLWGPTNAAPIINHVARFAEQADKDPNAQVSREVAVTVFAHAAPQFSGCPRIDTTLTK